MNGFPESFAACRFFEDYRIRGDLFLKNGLQDIHQGFSTPFSCLGDPAAVILIGLVFPRIGPRYISLLTCPKCGKPFDYNWVPGASFSALRLGGGNRYLQCPNCHEWSTFDVRSTRASSRSREKKVVPSRFG